MTTQHILYTEDDFTKEEIDNENRIWKMVHDGLSVCKCCGAAEADVNEFETCEEFRLHQKKQRWYDEELLKRKKKSREDSEEISLMIQLIEHELSAKHNDPQQEAIMRRTLSKLQATNTGNKIKAKKLEELPSDYRKYLKQKHLDSLAARVNQIGEH